MAQSFEPGHQEVCLERRRGPHYIWGPQKARQPLGRNCKVVTGQVSYLMMTTWPLTTDHVFVGPITRLKTTGTRQWNEKWKMKVICPVQYLNISWTSWARWQGNRCYRCGTRHRHRVVAAFLLDDFTPITWLHISNNLLIYYHLATATNKWVIDDDDVITC